MLKKLFAITLSIFASSYILVSCGSLETTDDTEINEDSIYGSYSASFDAGEQEVKRYVQFRFDGSTGNTIRLTEPAQITVDGEVMEVFDGEDAWINLNGTFYRKNAAPETPKATYSFEWTRQDGSKHTNVVLSLIHI